VEAASEAVCTAVVNMSQIRASGTKGNAARAHWIAERLLDRSARIIRSCGPRSSRLAEHVPDRATTMGYIGCPSRCSLRSPSTPRDQPCHRDILQNPPTRMPPDLSNCFGREKLNWYEIAAKVQGPWYPGAVRAPTLVQRIGHDVGARHAHARPPLVRTGDRVAAT